MSKPNDFQEKLKVEMRNAKRVLFVEEARSALSAVFFGCGAAYLYIEPLSFWSILALWVCIRTARNFKQTCKKQFILDKHMQFLKDSKGEKVWTPED